MSQDTNVTVNLKVKPGSNGGAGWSDAIASNGQPYSYKYTGGKDNKGDMENPVNSGAASLQVNLDTDQERYALNGATFENDPDHQLTWSQQNNATGTITDANTAVASAKYIVQVTDTSVYASIPCDPMIINKP